MNERRGERGPTGDHGQMGDIGLTGETGPTGETGLTGDTGRPGPPGLTGRRGAEGPSVPAREWRRFKRIIYTVMALLVLSSGFLWWQQQHFARQECEARNARTQATGESLAKLAEAHRLDGNAHASAVWQSFVDVSARNPAPPC